MISSPKAFVVLILGIVASAQAIDLTVDDVLKTYKRLEGRRVTLVGLADVQGSDFYVWDLRDRTHKNLKRAISVLWDTRLPNYPPGSNIAHYTYLNLRRVRITGTVDSRFHGRWGDIPFGIDLDRVEVLPGDRERKFLRDIGVFHNSMSQAVEIRMYSRLGSLHTFMTGIAPGEYNDTALEEGFATVALRAPGSELSEHPKKLLSRYPISFTRENRRHYDSRQHVYYFDIKDGRIRLVMPQEAKQWDLLPMVERN